MLIHSQLVVPPHAALLIANDAEANISHFNKMLCFCPLCTGIFVLPKVICPKANPTKVFIGCFQWTGPGTGCGYFMDPQQSHSHKLHLQRTKMYKHRALDQNQVLNTKNTYAVLHRDSAVPPLHPAWDASVNEETFNRMLAQSAEQPEVVNMPRSALCTPLTDHQCKLACQLLVRPMTRCSWLLSLWALCRKLAV
ncbi:hypothetical protein BC835DRAFT_1101212 [Cytidiella melzeri]|nr:hypothetical protein BC835DRAFT_1101212 [Cytidiella melzeri]